MRTRSPNARRPTGALNSSRACALLAIPRARTECDAPPGCPAEPLGTPLVRLRWLSGRSHRRNCCEHSAAYATLSVGCTYPKGVPGALEGSKVRRREPRGLS